MGFKAVVRGVATGSRAQGSTEGFHDSGRTGATCCAPRRTTVHQDQICIGIQI